MVLEVGAGLDVRLVLEVWVALALGLFRRWSSDRGGRFEGRGVVLEVGLGLKVGLKLGVGETRLGCWAGVGGVGGVAVAAVMLRIWLVMKVGRCWS